MSIYFLGIIILLLIILVSGILIYFRYRKSSGFFYLLLSCCICLWIILYFLSFDNSLGSERILEIYRLQYSLSIIGFYSLFSFILCFTQRIEKQVNYYYGIAIFFIAVAVIANFTPLIVKEVAYSSDIGSYIEVFGPLYLIFVTIYLLIFPSILGVAYWKLKQLSNLDRTRLIYIISGFFIYIALSLGVLVLIPLISADASQLYGEKYLPFFVLPFVLAVLYSSYKYDFSDTKLYLNSILLHGISAFLSIVWLMMCRLYISNMDTSLHNFWDMNSSLTWLDIFLGIILYIIFHKLFRHFKTEDEMKERYHELQEQIPFISNLGRLNIFISSYFFDVLYIKDVRMTCDLKKYRVLTEHFEKNKNMTVIVNDFVFWEKNRQKIVFDELKDEIGHQDMLIFPLRKANKDISGLLFIGKKIVPDSYSSQEIEIFTNFSKFLSGHLKYVEIYNRSQELNLTLDKRVDEKTIEFNNLISRQKEFIAYLGHEIRNPITNIIFLTSDIQNSVEKLKQTKDIESIGEDVVILNDELLKIAELTKSIFSTEKMDLGKIKLYKKKVAIYDFIYNEIITMEKTFPDVNFMTDMKNIGEFDIDEVQFREVIHNLLTNALKFTPDAAGKILITMKEKNESLIIDIHDNGPGLSDIDIANIFEKYATGTNDAIGLGMGLYLCKRIVELHGGTIQAGNSQKLGGAKFTIKM